MKSQGQRRDKLRFGWVAGLLQTALLCCIACSSALWSPKAAAEDKTPTHYVTLAPVDVTSSVYVGVPGDSFTDWGFYVASDYFQYGSGGYFQHNNDHATNIADYKKGLPCSGADVGRPINVGTGTKLETYPVFALPGEMGLSFTLYYNSSIKNPDASFNPVWSTNLQYTLTPTHCAVDKQGVLVCHALLYLRPDGSEIVFTGGPSGPFTEVGGDGLTTVSYNSASGTYTLHDEDATTKVFDDTFGTLLSITDASGISWTITTSGFTTTVTHSSGKSYSLTIGTTVNGVTPVTVTDPAGNVYTLQMAGNDFGSNILSIAYPGTPATKVSFQYSPAAPDLLTEVDYNGVPYDYTSYDTTSGDPYYRWATGNYFADNSDGVTIQYGTDAAGNVQATVTNSLGHSRVQTYDGTNGPGGAYNGQLTQLSNDAVTTCGGTTKSTSYDVNGNPSQAIDNNGNVHTYTYAATGQLQTETEAYGTSLARITNYVWDPDIQLNRLLSVTVVGWSKTTYTYNAQNRLASVAVTNLSGTGNANQTLTTTYGYTLYTDGMVHTLTVVHPSPGNSDTDTYTYDTLGNLTSVANGLGQVTTYSNYNGLGEVGRIVGPNGDTTDVVYDARGRVQTKTTYPNGTAATWTYGYDGYGLLASELSPVGDTTSWNRDPEMRVTSIVRNDKDGTSTESFGYDLNSDVTSHTVSRNGTTSVSETLRYDALGRVYQRVGMHGQLLTYGYDGNGNVLSVTDAAGHSVSSQYDALNRLTRKTSSGGASPPIPSTAPTLSAPANSSNGSYSVSWSAVSGATGYLLQEQVNGGSWSTVQTGGSTSFALSNQASGTYGYRVIACNVTGCSPWSSTATVYVTQITGNIDGVPIDGSGNASVGGWACSTGLAQSISADLYLGGPYGTGTYIGRYVANQSSEPAVASACHVSSGSYRYNIPLSAAVRGQYAGQAIYIYGISPVGAANLLINNSGSLVIPVNEPAGAPTLSVPGTNGTGSYTVSWSAVTGATSYPLQEQVNGGAWTAVQNSAATSWAISGKSNGSYGYRVQACNSSGCNAWSNVASVTVLLPPAAPAGISAPASSSGIFFVTWSASATATSYTLQQSANGGGWTTVYSSAANGTTLNEAATGSYTLRVQACNSGGCSGWTGSSAVAVTIPPASAPSLSVPASSSNGSYTVSWTGVSGATSYPLQEQVNGGSWSTIQNSSATSDAFSGKGNGSYGYRVQACNVSGCGPWSGTKSVVVTRIPVTPAGLTATIDVINLSGTLVKSAGTLSPMARQYAYQLSASWSAATGATSYTFQYCQSGGTCTTQSGSTTSVSGLSVVGSQYTVSVQACNAGGCSAWSAAITPAVVND